MKKRNLALGIVGGIAAAVGLKFLKRPATVEWDDVADEVIHSEHSRFVSVDGARVHYQEFGNASDPAMILIHGYTASVYAWKTAAPLLADAGFHLIAVDLVGFGYSDKPTSFDYSIESQARWISRFMNRLGIGRAFIVGSSYGGAVAAILAMDYSERVEKLVLVATVCNDDAKAHPVLRLASVPGIGEIITPLLADSKLFLRFRMHGTLAKANHHLITKDRIESIRRPLLAADGHRSLLATSRNWHACRIEQDAHLIDRPTLIIWGEQDTVIPIENGYKLRNSILNSKLVVIRDCGHVPQEEKSQLFTKLVAAFCQSKQASASYAANRD
ncbi:MAG: alpha/beta fold hydrolase [Pyrinomonadaceae bacterium]